MLAIDWGPNKKCGGILPREFIFFLNLKISKLLWILEIGLEEQSTLDLGISYITWLKIQRYSVWIDL